MKLVPALLGARLGLHLLSAYATLAQVHYRLTHFAPKDSIKPLASIVVGKA